MSSSGHRRIPVKKQYVVLCAGIVPLLSACSWVLVEGPPPGYERFNSVPCTIQKVLPTTDVALSALTTWMGLMVLFEEDFPLGLSHDDFTLSKTGGAVTFLTAGVLAGISGGIGYSRVTACREAQLEVAARNRGITAQNRDGSAQSLEYNWLDQLFPVFPRPIFGANPFGADSPDLPVTIPSLRRYKD